MFEKIKEDTKYLPKTSWKQWMKHHKCRHQRWSIVNIGVENLQRVLWNNKQSIASGTIEGFQIMVWNHEHNIISARLKKKNCCECHKQGVEKSESKCKRQSKSKINYEHTKGKNKEKWEKVHNDNERGKWKKVVNEPKNNNNN